MIQPAYRHEYKHTINLQDYHTVRQRLKAAAKPDPNAGAKGCYHVRSLYFDNEDDKALREKIDGLPNREKFRIRIYNRDSSLIKLEKKSKMRERCNKRATTLSLAQTKQILAGETDWMRDSQDPLLLELYVKMREQRLRPRTIVDYTREAYSFPLGNVRITFDSEIRTGLYAKDLFAGELPLVSVCPPGIMLLEVKYDDYLPELMRALIQTNTRRTESFSKYAECRIYG